MSRGLPLPIRGAEPALPCSWRQAAAPLFAGADKRICKCTLAVVTFFTRTLKYSFSMTFIAKSAPAARWIYDIEKFPTLM